jgi:hypothetical protein
MTMMIDQKMQITQKIILVIEIVLTGITYQTIVPFCKSSHFGATSCELASSSEQQLRQSKHFTTNVKLSLENNNRTLVVRCRWPDLMQKGGLDELHRRWKVEDRDMNFSNRLQAMDSAMEVIKRKCDGDIFSTFRLHLQFEAAAEFAKYWISNTDGCRVLYVDLAEVVAEKPKEEDTIQIFEDAVEVAAARAAAPSDSQ